MPTPGSSEHTWSFFRTGGFDQVRVDSGADLLALRHLDQKLWVALACPSTGLEFDDRTLALIDANGDGRIRAPEVLDAVQWAAERLRSADCLIAGAPALPLADIDTSTERGETLLRSAKQILANLGRPDDTSIRPDDTADTARLFANTKFNGDGIVPPDAADDEATAALIEEVLACTTPATDRSGKPGITRETLATFFEQAQAFSDWWSAAEAEGVLPLGESTGAAADALLAVSSKVEDYFARCRLAAFDPRAVQALNRQESEYLEMAAKDMSITPDEVAGLPLARVDGSRPLPLHKGINPAWTARIKALVALAISPLLGPTDTLTEQAWDDLRARFAAFETWRESKPTSPVESLGLPRVRAILSSDGRAAIEALLDKDEALKDEAEAIEGVNKLVHLHRDLITLVRNFVNFEQFYDPTQSAIFQIGTLYLDQRSCKLVLRVREPGKHSVLAPLSRAYLAYCTCVRKSTGQTMDIVAAFTGGSTDNLMVGRNGIFYDRDGNDWDATITKIVANPVSIREAFWSPYKRALAAIEAQLAKRAEAADKAADDKLSSLTDVTTKAGASKDGIIPPRKSKFDVGVIAALGVAVGGLVAALGMILEVFFGLGKWMPVGLMGLMLLISGPSMFIAALKLRQRNLGPLLDANGWAVNAKAKINIPFGRSLTGVAHLPDGARRDLKDPYSQGRTGLRFAIFAVVIALAAAAWWFGALDSALPDMLDRASVLGSPGPATE